MQRRVGLYYMRDKLKCKPRPKLVDVRPFGEEIKIRDLNGRTVILSRQNAIVVFYALGVTLGKSQN